MTQAGETMPLVDADGRPSTARANRQRYEMMRDALLRVIPADEKGIPFKELADRVAAILPPEFDASVGWYTTAVKLDLEGRGLIERVPKVKPQHVRRARPSGPAR